MMTQIPPDFVPAPDLLRDKVILLTGATGGFGKPVSRTLARHGATVNGFVELETGADPVFKRVYESYAAFRKKYAIWKDHAYLR